METSHYLVVESIELLPAFDYVFMKKNLNVILMVFGLFHILCLPLLHQYSINANTVD